jgi:DNA-binding GntR family transcriptional regulator
MLEYHAKFHNTIYSATQSEVFIEVMSKLNDKYHWLRAIALRANKQSPKLALKDHKRMVAALQEKNPKELRKVFKLHLRHTLEKYNSVAALFQ